MSRNLLAPVDIPQLKDSSSRIPLGIAKKVKVYPGDNGAQWYWQDKSPDSEAMLLRVKQEPFWQLWIDGHPEASHTDLEALLMMAVYRYGIYFEFIQDHHWSGESEDPVPGPHPAVAELLREHEGDS